MYNYQQAFFENTVKTHPNLLAVDDGENTATYSELNARANKIAHVLKDLGAGPNERVCIFTNKTIHQYSAVLGTLKSGACWVPLSKNFPEQRISQLLKSLQPKAILVDHSTVVEAKQILSGMKIDLPIVCLDPVPTDQGKVISSQTVDEASAEGLTGVARCPSDLAYIIFTSGSTGTPKGVMVTHQSTCQFLSSCFDFFVFDQGLRFAHFSDLTFDPSVFDLFYCWANAGTLVPFNKRSYRINPALFFKEQKIQALFTVPSVIAKLRDSGYLGMNELKSLRHLLLTGEPVTSSLVADWYKHYPDSTVYNMYGTTETAIVSHWHRIPKTISPDQSLPVGQPLPGIRILLGNGDTVIDPSQVKSQSPVTFGESIVIGSQLSAGYWDNEYQTNTSFRSHPIDPRIPQKAYFTGDILRVDSDNLYYYMGRVDHQVKVRGHRVELGEIESALIGNPSVLEAVVVPVSLSNQGYDKQLIAFIKTQQSIRTDLIEKALSEKLPEYMIPSQIMVVSEIPYNQNGKIDRIALEQQARKALEFTGSP